MFLDFKPVFFEHFVYVGHIYPLPRYRCAPADLVRFGRSCYSPWLCFGPGGFCGFLLVVGSVGWGGIEVLLSAVMARRAYRLVRIGLWHPTPPDCIRIRTALAEAFIKLLYRYGPILFGFFHIVYFLSRPWPQPPTTQCNMRLDLL